MHNTWGPKRNRKVGVHTTPITHYGLWYNEHSLLDVTGAYSMPTFTSLGGYTLYKSVINPLMQVYLYYPLLITIYNWLVVSTPLKNMSPLG